MSWLPFLSVETWVLLITFICIFVSYGYWTFGVFEKLGIPGPKPVFYMGTVGQLNPVYYLDDLMLAKKYGKVWGMYELRKPILVVMKPEMLKTILVKEFFTYFTNRRNLRLNGELHDAVSIVEDDQWRRIRNIVSPCFASGRIKDMFIIMKQYSKKLTEKLKSTVSDNEVVEVKSVFGPYSMDVMMSCVLSIDVDTISNPSSSILTQAGKLFRVSIPLFLFQGCFPVFLPLLELLGFSLFSRSVCGYFKAFMEKIRLDRKESSQQTPRDIFQYLINSKTAGDSKRGLTDHEILSQVISFLLGGYETSATTMVFLAYNLARNPEAMRRLQDEIDATFPNKGEIQYDALMQMEYLDSVISECLRLYPPLARLERAAKESVKIDGITIPKGMIVMIPVYAMHHDPEVWPEPEEFKPERFSKENKQNIAPFTYLPFGAGPRNCVGLRFALVKIKLVMVEILRNYSFAVCEETEIPLQMDPQGILGPLRPIKLKIVRRSEAQENVK